MLIVPFYKKHKFSLNFNLKENFSIFKSSSKLGFSAKFEGITISFIPFLLGIIISDEAVGIFGIPLKIFMALLAVVQGVSMTLMPDIFKNFKKDLNVNKTKIGLFFYIFLLTGIILAVFIFFGSEKLILFFFGESFIESVGIMKTFSITIILWPILMFLGLMIIALNRYTIYLYLTAGSAIISVLLSVVLINLFGLDGAEFVLPLTALGSIILGLIFLSSIFKNLDISFTQLFSVSNAYSELKNSFAKKNVDC
jgi:O-antigen/teichoic acid export membrane protein